MTRRELLAAGVSSDEIRQRLGSGALIAGFRGVYRVGHTAPSVLAWYVAAVKACGDRALLCGRAAAHLWGLVKGAAPAPEVMTRTVRRVEGVLTRRGLDRRDAASYRGIPITSVARTLVDLAAVVDAGTLARACHEAGVKYRTTPAQVEVLLARRPNAAGAAKLRAVLIGDTKVTLSRLESLFIALLRKHNLPLPETNSPQAAGASTAAGQSTSSPSRSTATASTTAATPGSRATVASAKPTPAATSSAATPGPTSTTTPSPCSPSYAGCL